MKHPVPFLLFLTLCVSLAGCQVAGGIFKGGFYTGIFAVVAVIVLILWLVMRGRRS